jgi:hypothetical protein
MSAPTHLFISYVSEDRTFAEWLARKLASAGYAVWLDTLKRLGGEPWPQTIDAALNRSVSGAQSAIGLSLPFDFDDYAAFR